MGAIITSLYVLGLIVLGVFSYGFIDPNLTLSENPIFLQLTAPLKHLAYYAKPEATIIFLVILLLMFATYLYFLKSPPKIWVIIIASIILVFSYPALTYDVFNYIATAKVAFAYRENPYVVMPVEIPNDPNLAFTRAANKVALYGPVWIFLSAIPHYLGAGDVWRTVIAFKLMNALVYLGFVYFIYRVTKNITNVLFFALNPLVLIEVIMNGHNDIYMIALALVGLRYKNYIALFVSWFVKGATVILAPLMFLRMSWEKILIAAYWLLALVFFVAAPLREELYPWYAVWLVATAALMPLKSHRFIFGFTIVLSFALELRALPYMWMGYYEGPGPILRLLLTVIPVGIYLLYFSYKKQHEKK